MPKRRRYKSYAWTHPKTKKLYARIQIKQPDGTIKSYLRPANNLTHADQLASEMLEDYAVRKTGFIEGAVMTFDDLAKWYVKTRAVPPVYNEQGAKLSGMRTYENVRRRIKHLQKFLGPKLIKDITEDTLVLLKFWLQKQSPKSKPASINRYLEDLRAMLKQAVRKRWLKENPFDFGDRVIDSGLEEVRERVITRDEEYAILRIARERDRTLLYYALLTLLETGARPSELYEASTMKGEPICWSDLLENDFQAVRLTSLKGRLKKVRYAPVLDRAENALRELYKERKPDQTDKVFPVRSFKTSWSKVRKLASIYLTIADREQMAIEKVFEANDLDELVKKYEKDFALIDLRIRDLRRAFNSRMADDGIENDIRQKMLGHSEHQTNFDYTAVDLQTALDIKKRLDRKTIETDSVN